MTKYPQTCIARVFGLALLSSLIINPLFSAKWKEITPEEMAQTESSVDPEYGAEFLFIEREIRQGVSGFGDLTERDKVYERIKVFNQQGIEQLLEASVKYAKGQRITGLEGRTIKPDGTIIELDKDNIFTNEVVEKGKTEIREKSFAFPGLEPGDIVELQYLRSGRTGKWWQVYYFRSRLPAQRVYLEFQPMQEVGHSYTAFHLSDDNWLSKKRTKYEFLFEDMPASSEEPYSLPKMQSEPNFVLYYFSSKPKKKNYWETKSKELYRDGKNDLKPSRDIRAFVEEYTQDESNNRDKLKKLYLYCQDEITNLRYSYGIYTDEEREELPNNKNPDDTFENGYGTPDDLCMLFGAMARVLGYNAQKASVADSRYFIFSPEMTVFYSLPDDAVAIENGENLEFFNPGNPFLPFGSLEWWSSHTSALVGKPKKGELVHVPMQSADYSMIQRKAELALDQYGTLTGDITIVYSGYCNLDAKHELSYRLGREQKIEWVEELLTDNISNVEFTNIKLENIGDSNKPLILNFTIEIPEYADYTGKRLFVQPALFQKGEEPLFKDDKRENMIIFPYPWMEIDYMKISLPEGYEIESGSAPAPLNLGALGSFEVVMGTSPRDGSLVLQRKMRLDGFRIPVNMYGPVKQAFEMMNYQDQHTITFRKQEDGDQLSQL